MGQQGLVGHEAGIEEQAMRFLFPVRQFLDQTLMTGHKAGEQGRGATARPIVLQRRLRPLNDIWVGTQLQVIVADQVESAGIDDLQRTQESCLLSLFQFILQSQFEQMGQGSLLLKRIIEKLWYKSDPLSKTLWT